MLSLIPAIGPSPNAKKLLFRLSLFDGELLSTPKMTTFLAKSLPKLHEPPSIAIPRPLWVNLLLIALFTNLTVTNKQFFSGKLLLGLQD